MYMYVSCYTVTVRTNHGDSQYMCGESQAEFLSSDSLSISLSVLMPLQRFSIECKAIEDKANTSRLQIRTCM